MVVIIITTTTTTHRENEKSNYFSNNASSTRVFNKSFLLLLLLLLLLLSFHRISMIFTKKIVINFILKEQNPLRTTILLEKFSKRGGGRGGLSKSKSVDPIIRLYLKTLSPPSPPSFHSGRTVDRRIVAAAQIYIVITRGRVYSDSPSPLRHIFESFPEPRFKKHKRARDSSKEEPRYKINCLVPRVCYFCITGQREKICWSVCRARIDWRLV